MNEVEREVADLRGKHDALEHRLKVLEDQNFVSGDTHAREYGRVVKEMEKQDKGFRETLQLTVNPIKTTVDEVKGSQTWTLRLLITQLLGALAIFFMDKFFG